MKTPPLLLTLVATLTLAASVGHGAVPGEVNYQGLLLDSVGSPVTGNVGFVFSLFDGPAGGTAFWSEVHASVDVLDGVYDVVLGSTTPITPGLIAGGDLYLEISVAGETLTPRQRILAVPFAVNAASAESASSVGGISSLFVTEILEHFSFDGQDPPNLDPSEGIVDVDGDTLANFVDPDNDGDGVDDQDELAQGSDINLVTPILQGFDPAVADGTVTTNVTVTGQNFQAGLGVAFGTENPTPQNVTSTSFDVDVGPQALGAAPVVVTIPNAESATGVYAFDVPSISSLVPSFGDAASSNVITVNGTGFVTGMSVSFGSENPTPQNLTPTRFDVTVGPQPAGQVTVAVSYPVGTPVTAFFDFVGPTISSLVPSVGDAASSNVVTVNGTGFGPGIFVSFGSENPTPQNLTPTSFDVTVGPQAGGLVTVGVSFPPGTPVTDFFEFVDSSTAKKVFVTSTASTGDLGGIAGADATCASLASAASLPGTFLAWIGDSTTDPPTRFTRGAPYELVNGTPIASSFVDLTDGLLINPIDRDESDAPMPLVSVWTGLDAFGVPVTGANDFCVEWTGDLASSRAIFGQSNFTASQWSVLGNGQCSIQRSLYCFEQ